MVRMDVLPHPATLKCEVVDFSETLKHLYNTVHHHIPKHHSPQILVLAHDFHIDVILFDPLKLKT